MSFEPESESTRLCRTFAPDHVPAGPMVQPFPRPRSLIPLKLPLIWPLLKQALFPSDMLFVGPAPLPAATCPYTAPHLQIVPDTPGPKFLSCPLLRNHMELPFIQLIKSSDLDLPLLLSGLYPSICPTLTKYYRALWSSRVQRDTCDRCIILKELSGCWRRQTRVKYRGKFGELWDNRGGAPV